MQSRMAVLVTVVLFEFTHKIGRNRRVYGHKAGEPITLRAATIDRPGNPAVLQELTPRHVRPLIGTTEWTLKRREQ
jgi:hypothetical protein